RLERNRLKGVTGDAINAVLAAAAMNFRKLLRASARIFARQIIVILSRLLPRWNLISSQAAVQAA
ncbi:MAG TPA: hypothetical protein VE291_06950, partial [Terracidiphilus sp.]|nr:hypothetical protein [Terracidiphilus sp.]